MRFTQAIGSFLLGAALTSFATAAAVDNRVVVRDDDSPFSDLDIDDDVWENLSNLCGGSADEKRGIYDRATKPSLHDEVIMGKMGSYGSIPLGLWTKHLVTCHGVVVTGTPKDGKDSRFLAHFTADKSGMDSLWKEFSDKVKDAELSDAKAWASFPDLSKDYPNGWTGDSDKEGAEKAEKKMTDLLKDLIGSDPTPKYHSMSKGQAEEDESGTMAVDGSNVVSVDGVPV
jgi:hypothetical protein